MKSMRRVLLLEPSYPNKYPPLGLMKLATYHRRRGDFVRVVKGGGVSTLLESPWDRVYVTTLFSFEWNRTAAAIDLAIDAVRGQAERVFVGGISASLMHEAYVAEARWAGVRFIRGLLNGPPAIALQLSSADREFGWDDLSGTPIEELTPDYEILDHVDYTYPVRDAYFGYASRGCVRKCSFCGVPKLEGAQKEMPPLASLIHGVSSEYGEKRDLILMDNNIVASARYSEVIAEIRDLGFKKGARLSRDGQRPVLRRVDFNQGIDARIIVKSPMFLREMSTICIDPLRIAFDHIGMHRTYEQAIRMAADNDITKLSNYMLYNFMDSPQDLYARMRLNIDLNHQLGIRIWSFPMRYLPVDRKDRSHVGKHWNRYFLRSFQIMLQATRGVVSGNESFFMHAYGHDADEFVRLLALPHSFLFHRLHYSSGAGRAVLDEYQFALAALSDSERNEFRVHLERSNETSESLSRYFKRISSDSSISLRLRAILRFHVFDTRDRISHVSHPHSGTMDSIPLEGLAEDETVEDAGLFDEVLEDGVGMGAATRGLGEC